MNEQRLRQSPNERFKGASVTFDLREEIDALRAEDRPSHAGHRQKTLFKHNGCTIALFVMEAGGSIPDHKVNGTVSIRPVEGEVALRLGDDEHVVTPGQILVMPSEQVHDVRALTDAVFVLQVALESE